VRPEEAFGGDWSDVDLEAGVFTVRTAYAKGKLKTYNKDRAIAAAGADSGEGDREPRNAQQPRGHPVPRGRRRADRHQQLAHARVRRLR
jgi:hypothetical protein